MSDVVQEQATPSVEIGRRAAQHAESRMLVDGELVAAESGGEFDNVSPATGLVLGATAAAGANDMARAIGAARRAFDETDWSTNGALRKRCLDQLQDAIASERDELREELIAEVGCPDMTIASAQLDWPLADSLRYPAGLIDDFEWERPLDGGGLFGERNVRTVVKEPVGVVGAITPSNFPIEVILNKLGPALATGNTVVLKPDPEHSLERDPTRPAHRRAHRHSRGCGERRPDPVQRRRRDAGHRPPRRHDLVHRVHCRRQAADAAGRRHHEADVPRTRRQVGGSSCSTTPIPPRSWEPRSECASTPGRRARLTTRMLVHRSLFDDAVATITAAYRRVPVGDPVTAGNPCRPGDQRRAEGAGARPRSSGRGATAPRSPPAAARSTNLPAHLAGGHYVQPTVIVGVDNSAAIAQDEVFGPVLIVMPFDDDDEAVRIANDSAFGLAGAVISRSMERGMNIARRIRTGSFGVNGGMFYGADAPFGGYKSSGIGRQCGIEGFQQYLETKTIAHRVPRQG